MCQHSTNDTLVYWIPTLLRTENKTWNRKEKKSTTKTKKWKIGWKMSASTQPIMKNVNIFFLYTTEWAVAAIINYHRCVVCVYSKCITFSWTLRTNKIKHLCVWMSLCLPTFVSIVWLVSEIHQKENDRKTMSIDLLDKLWNVCMQTDNFQW